MVGRTILHYKVTEKLGEGGMGVVYKAEDTQLRRTVALKFLPRETLDEEEVKARLIREAQAAAALDHPNICQVFGIHEEDGETFIAMAYIDGPSLAEKIKERPLPLDEALAMAAQIAEGLHEAHEHGVVHRDIKPQNVMLTSKGQVKILDFGLASLTGRSKLTKTGTTMGTPAYMAPEQLEGRNVDRRADVWALGCVLYEMLTQKTPFEADYEQAIGYGILNEDPEPVTALRMGLPPKVDDLLAKALAKDRDERYQHADELLADLRVLQKQSSGARKTSSGRRSTMSRAAGQTVNPVETLPPDFVPVRRSSQRALQALAAVATLAFLGLLAVYLTQAPPETPTRRFSFSQEGVQAASISPDGRHVAFSAETDGESSLWLRAIGTETAREIPGTEGARRKLAWSPDSQAIVFATTTEIKRVGIDGGDAITLGELLGTSFEGVSWSPDGERIVFSSGIRLLEIPARGGESKFLMEQTQVYGLEPHFLPTDNGSEGLVYTDVSVPPHILVLNLETGERSEIGPGSAPVYSPDGYLIHGSGQTDEPGLRALPFSLATLEPTGEAFPVSEGGQFASIALDGTLLFLDGNIAGAQQGTLVWRNREGEMLETIGQPQPGLSSLSLSPDGQRIAVTSVESGNQDIWIYDLSRSTKTRLTLEDGTESRPTWSPSGAEIAYRTRTSLLRKAADGTGEAVVLVEAEAESGQSLWSPSWSQDGKYMLYFDVNPDTKLDIHYLELRTNGDAPEPTTFLSTPGREFDPKLSPDGHVLAYVSDESGRKEIYVRPFPDGAGKWPASVNGGAQPRWRGDGKELYYVDDSTMMAVSVSTEPTFALGQPQPLFESVDLKADTGTKYDVSANGKRFVTISPVEDDEEEEEAPSSIRIVQNWYEEFRDRGQN